MEHLSLTDNFWKRLDKQMLKNVVVSIFTKTKLKILKLFLERDVTTCQKINYEEIIQDATTNNFCSITKSNHQIIQTRPTRIGNKCGVKYRILMFIELLRI